VNFNFKVTLLNAVAALALVSCGGGGGGSSSSSPAPTGTAAPPPVVSPSVTPTPVPTPVAVPDPDPAEKPFTNLETRDDWIAAEMSKPATSMLSIMQARYPSREDTDFNHSLAYAGAIS